MKKNKIIIISLVLAMCVALILNIIYSKLTAKEKIYIFVAKSNLLKGEKLSMDNLEIISSFKESLNGLSNLISNEHDISSGLILCENVYAGQIITSSIVCEQEKLLEENYEYISIPVSTSTDAASYLLKKGDCINIYFTGKYRQISNVIANNESLIYSSNDDNALVTYKLYDGILLYGTSDSNGIENQGTYSNIIVRIKKEDISTLVVLKDLGNFTITKSVY